MITTASEHQVDKVEQMAGGKGHVIIEHLLGEKELDGKCGLYAKVTIEPNCTLGFHEHHGETETYYILSGEGSYNDGEKSYPVKAGDVAHRQNGVLVSMATGTALTYSLETLQARGKLFVEHGQEIYNGQIVGLNSRDNDMGVNPTKGKKLDNMRASGKDETIALVPPVRFTLEQALEFIQDDELCEVTPKSIRLRKKILDEGERTRAAKKAKN